MLMPISMMGSVDADGGHDEEEHEAQGMKKNTKETLQEFHLSTVKYHPKW